MAEGEPTKYEGSKWEYLTTMFLMQKSNYFCSPGPSSDSTDEQLRHTAHLNRLGDEGWELVASHVDASDVTIFISTIFKRPIKNAPRRGGGAMSIPAPPAPPRQPGY